MHNFRGSIIEFQANNSSRGGNIFLIAGNGFSNKIRPESFERKNMDKKRVMQRY